VQCAGSRRSERKEWLFIYHLTLCFFYFPYPDIVRDYRCSLYKYEIGKTFHHLSIKKVELEVSWTMTIIATAPLSVFQCLVLDNT